MGPQLAPHPSLSPPPHPLILALSHFLSHGPNLEFSAKQREMEGEDEDEGVGSEVEKMSIYFPSPRPP